MMNVIIVNDFNYSQGGASQVALDTANILVDNPGVNVTFFSCSSTPSSVLNPEINDVFCNIPENLVDSNRVRGTKNGIYNAEAKKAFKKLLSDFDKKDTIIHVHGWTKCLSSSVIDEALEQGFKVVVTLHDYFTACPNGGYFNYKTNQICTLTPMCKECVATNCDSRNYGFKLYRVLRQKRYQKTFSKVKYYITISDFSEKILKKTLTKNAVIKRINNPMELAKVDKIKPSQNDYYLFVGRVTLDKGIELFCQAITDLGLKGIVLGEGTEKSRLEKQFPNIEFTGWQDKESVKKYMRGARALIFPSLWYEAAPLVPLEAISMGLPVLTTDCNAATEYFSDKKYIFHDLDGLKNMLAEFQKSVSVPTVDLSKYSVKTYNKSILDYYNKILKGNKS